MAKGIDPPPPEPRRARRLLQLSVVIVLLMALGVLGWLGYRRWSLGCLHLTAPPDADLLAEVLDEHDQVVHTTRVGGPTSIELPAGSYRLRVTDRRVTDRYVPLGDSVSALVPLVIQRGERQERSAAWAAIQLTADAPPLQVEVRDEQDQCLVPAFALAPKKMVFLPPGVQRLVLSAPSRPNVTYRLLVGDGMRRGYVLSLDKPALSAGTDAWRWLGRCTPAADFDGDGVVDLFHERTGELFTGSDNGGVLSIISGRDGRLLWQSPHGSARMTPLRTDLDGDGLTDLLVSGSRVVDQQYELYLEALSGKTGQTIWTAQGLKPDDRTDSFGFYLKDCYDLHGDGRPTVICCYTVKPSWSPNEGPGRAATVRPWMTAVDGKNGALLWKAPLSEARVLKGLDLGLGQLRPVLADLDGDGVRDLVFWVQNVRGGDIKDTHYSLEAISGREGRRLWSWDKPPGLRAKEPTPADAPTREFPLPVVADLDGDGFPAVILRDDRKQVRVLVLNGKDGKQKWVWEGPALEDADIAWGLLGTPPQVVRLKDGPFIVAISPAAVKVGDKGGEKRVGFQLVLLDNKGAARQWRDLVKPAHGNAGYLPFWVRDVDGDGHDEVLIIDDGKLVVTRGGVTEALWTWTIPEGNGLVHEVLPAVKGATAVVVVRNPSHVYGLSGRDGKLLWRCPSAGTVVGVLPAAKAGEMPRVVFAVTAQDGQVQATVCRVPQKID